MSLNMKKKNRYLQIRRSIIKIVNDNRPGSYIFFIRKNVHKIEKYISF